MFAPIALPAGIRDSVRNEAISIDLSMSCNGDLATATFRAYELVCVTGRRFYSIVQIIVALRIKSMDNFNGRARGDYA